MCNGTCSTEGAFQVGDIAIANSNNNPSKDPKGKRILVEHHNVDFFNDNDADYYCDNSVSLQEIENFRLNIAEETLKRLWESGKAESTQQAVEASFNMADLMVQEYQKRRLI